MRLVLALTVAATLAAAAHLATHLGRTRVAALAVAPAALGWAFYWGFAPQMLGFALWLAVLPRLDRDAEVATARAAAGSTLAIALLGFAHVASMLCASVASAVLALVRPLDRRTPLRLAPALAGVVVAVLEERRERAASPLAQVFASRVLWHSPAQKLGSLVAYVVGDHGLVVEFIVGLLVLVAVVLWRTSGSRPSPTPRPGGALAWSVTASPSSPRSSSPSTWARRTP